MSTGIDGFEIDSNMDEETAKEVGAFNATLKRLRDRRLQEIAIVGALRKSKMAWKIATYQQPVLYRVVMLASGCAANWNDSNILCSYLAARALIETATVFLLFESDLQELIKGEKIPEIDDLITNRTFSTRDEEMVNLYPDTKATNIQTYIEKLDKKFNKQAKGWDAALGTHYNFLSERCHPNSFGQHQLFGIRDKTTNIITYSDRNKSEMHFDHVFAGMTLIHLVESAMNSIDGAILQVSEIQHRLFPVVKD
jgi:hypothetical protein